MYNEQATKAYLDTQIEIQAEIEKLQAGLADHNEKATQIHWGHVCDLEHILAELKQLNCEEE